jgi:hypothetical protein
MKHLLELILVIPLSIGMAAWHAHLEKIKRPIKHGWWALVYCIPVAAVMYFQGLLHFAWNWKIMWPEVAYALACFAGRLDVFNISLNEFRKLPIFYASTQTTSIVDRIEYWLVGKRVWIIEAFVFLLFMFLQFQFK